MSPSASALDFKTRDASSYDPLVDQFEAFTSRFSQPFAERLVALSQAAPGERILDVGSGTGIVTLLAGTRVGPAGATVGADLSDGMLQAARAKADRAGLRQVEFHKMDAEALQLRDHSFDVVLSLFALTHFPDPVKALNEMYRVLRPGGRLVLGVGGGPLRFSRAGLTCAGERLRRAFREWRGQQLTGPRFLDALTMTHLGDSLKEPEETAWAGQRGSRAARVRQLVTGAGFQHISVTWHEQQAVLATPEEFWEIQATWSSIARKRIAHASPEQVAALRADFTQICQQVRSRGGRLVYPIAAFYASARKP